MFRKHWTEPEFSQHLFPQQYLSIYLSLVLSQLNKIQKLHYSGKVAIQPRAHSYCFLQPTCLLVMDGHFIMKYFMLSQLTNNKCSITWH